MEKKTSAANELGGSYFYIRFSCSDEVFVAADPLVLAFASSGSSDAWEILVSEKYLGERITLEEADSLTKTGKATVRRGGAIVTIPTEDDLWG